VAVASEDAFICNSGRVLVTRRGGDEHEPWGL